MPLASLGGPGPEALTHINGDASAMRTHEIRQIGIRKAVEGEKRLEQE